MSAAPYPLVPAGPLAQLPPAHGTGPATRPLSYLQFQPDPWSALPRLVLQVGCLVEFFVVVDAERTHGARDRAHAANLRSEEARGHAGHHHDGRESVEVRHARAYGIAGDLGVVPLDRERDRRCAQDAEIVGVVRVLPDVLAINDQIFSERLLNPGVEFVAKAGSERSGIGGETPDELHSLRPRRRRDCRQPGSRNLCWKARGSR